MHRKQSKNQILFFGEMTKLKVGRMERGLVLDLAIDKSNLNNHQVESITNYCSINPQQLYTSPHHIAIIDTQHEAWLITEPFENPVNISKIINMKVNKISLGFKEMIVHTKTHMILINWGAKKFINLEKLTTIKNNSKQINNFLFQLFSINNENEEQFYHYTAEGYNRLYEMNGALITGFPSMIEISIKKRVRGISACKSHCLCWDEEGKLYSWGYRSLALGYGQLPQEQLNQIPREVKLQKIVLAAVTTDSYSLALVSEGKFFEWGIKKQVNQLNEEPIFRPRPLQFKYFNCKAKFVSLKGKHGNFAALASNNQLYVWGISAKIFLNPKIGLPIEWKGNYLYEPVLMTDLMEEQIVDYSIEGGHLCVNVGKRQAMDYNENEYWRLIKDNTKQQLQNCKVLRKIKQLSLNPSSQNLLFDFKLASKKNRTESNLDLHLLRKKYNKNPFLEQQSSKDHKIKYSQNRQTTEMKTETTELKYSNRFSESDLRRSDCFKLKIKTPSIHHQTAKNINTHKKQKTQSNLYSLNRQQSCKERSINEYEKVAVAKQKQKQPKPFSEMYKTRVKEMLQKKRRLYDQVAIENIKKIEESTLESKLKKKETQLGLKKVEWRQSLLKRSLLAYFHKNYFVKLLTSPLLLARNQKINNFSRFLKIQRIQRNICRMFESAKIKFSLQQLKQSNIRQFFLLSKYVKRYVIRFRLRKKERSRALVVDSIGKQYLKFRMKVGLVFIHQKVLPLSKLAEWHSNYNKVRKRLMKQLWNNFILSTFKVRDGVQFYFAPSNTTISFHQLYHEQRNKNPSLKLNSFMKNCQKQATSKRLQKCQTRNKRKGYIRFVDQIKQKSNISQILPYSLHSTYLKKPKHLEINILEGVKLSEGWIAIETQIVDKTINQIIFNFEKEFYVKTKKYQINLAHFIREKYEPFNEKRWKFIIEYNKILKTNYKERQEKELKRLLRLISQQQLYEQDCLPEKYIVLEQALKHPNAPKPPDIYIKFDFHRFTQEYLKGYWENLNLKAKKFR